jgi:16S rRNA (cytosine967-C5)-methyltransferase
MPISPARQIAYQVLIRVESGREFAVDLLQGAEVSALKEADRGLATELVMGVIRWRGELDFQVERLSGRKLKAFDAEVLTILRLGIYQIRFLERVPKRAAVNDAVEMTKAARKRSAAGLVNAVLRKCEPPAVRVAGQAFDQLSEENRASVRRAFPAWLWQRMAASAGESGELAALRLAYASLQTPPTTLRIVDVGADPLEVGRELEAEGVATAPCRYAAMGLAVQSGRVRNTRAYREGRVVIQDEASQLVAELLSPARGQRVLDLCAAPGMKAGQLAQRLGAGTLVACDRSSARLRTLVELLPKQVPSAVGLAVVQLDATRALPLGVKFDRILLDAPCSGTGTLARNPEIKWRLEAEDIARLAEMQARMLRQALSALAPGGRLVYATCSLEPEENEGVVGQVLGEQRGFRTLSAPELSLAHPRLAPLFAARGYFSTHPGQDAMDGFNAVVIVSTEN